MKTCTYVCCVNVAHLGSYLKSPCYPKSTPLYLRRAVVRLKKEGDVDTRSPSSRLYRLITHKFKVSQGQSVPCTVQPGCHPTSVCTPHHNNTRENLARGVCPILASSVGLSRGVRFTPRIFANSGDGVLCCCSTINIYSGVHKGAHYRY